MAIDKSLPNTSPEEIQVDKMAGLVPIEEDVPFGANLAEFIEEDQLQKMSDTLRADYEMDKSSRQDWERSYVDGIKLLGFKYEERARPFQGASGVTHPLLAESATQFQ